MAGKSLEVAYVRRFYLDLPPKDSQSHLNHNAVPTVFLASLLGPEQLCITAPIAYAISYAMTLTSLNFPPLNFSFAIVPN